MKRTVKNRKRKSDFSVALALISRNFGFILFMGAMALLYIYNTQIAEKKVRNIQNLEKEIQELKWGYMNLKADVMYSSTYSQVSKSVKSIDLDTKGSAPRRILAKD